MDLAKDHGDTPLIVRVLSDRAAFHGFYCQLEDTLADGRAAEQAGTLQEPPSVHRWRLSWMELAAWALGRPAEAHEIAKRLEPHMGDVGPHDGIEIYLQMRAWVEFGKDFDLTRLKDSL